MNQDGGNITHGPEGGVMPQDLPGKGDLRSVLMAPDKQRILKSPDDPEKAKRYSIDAATGEIILKPEVAEAIAQNYLTLLFEPKLSQLKNTGTPKLSLIVAGEQAATLQLARAAIQLAMQKYGVREEDVMIIDRTQETDKERLRKLKYYRDQGEAGREGRENYLKEIEAEELEGVSRVLRDDHSAYGGQLIISETNPEAFQEFNMEDRDALASARQPARELRSSEHKALWMLSSIPHPSTVEVDKQLNPLHPDKVTLENETYEWLLACERPLDQILLAQRKLVERVNQSYKLRVIAHPQDKSYKTDVTFDTTMVGPDGKTLVPRNFYNHAGYENNFPGSEVFGAPALDGGNGTIAYPYPVMFDGVLLPNLTLEVESGKIVSWEIKGDGELAQKAREKFGLKMDDPEHPNNRTFGEFGIGTSPFPSFNTRDIGFNEKRTGVHFALGKCYPREVDEAGNIADLDNGSKKANIHADLVIPGSESTQLELWQQIKTQDGGTRWRLLMYHGVFVEELPDGSYRADKDLTMLHDPKLAEGFEQPFSVHLPADTPARRNVGNP